jgi:hypothetical protein
MLTVSVVAEVQRLLALGVSQRAISRTVGVSRGSVHGIATGKRQLHDPRRDAMREPEIDIPRGPARRCPECGGMVQFPCLACQIRQLRRQRPAGLAVHDDKAVLTPIRNPDRTNGNPLYQGGEHRFSAHWPTDCDAINEGGPERIKGRPELAE